MKRFRIEGGAGLPPRPAADVAPAPDTDGWRSLHELAADLHAMQAAIATTKREVGDLQRSPVGADGMHRAACELDAVSTAVEQATTRILGSVEEIELSANILRSRAPTCEEAPAILEQVLALYEACNFQDIVGQRIRKVVTTLKFVEERLDRVIQAWNGAEHWNGPGAGVEMLSGPKLPGDEGHISQADVDVYFA